MQYGTTYAKTCRLAGLWLVFLIFSGDALTAAEWQEARVASTFDDHSQPVRYWIPPTADAPVPLLVLLHTWSGDYRQQTYIPVCLDECEARGWAFVAPNFRGPNVRPEAGGSPQAIADVLDAVAFMEAECEIDPTRVYLFGTSGGGHLSLLMAGRAPWRWSAVSAWVPISDLAAWHAESTTRKNRYAANLEALTGGPPGSSPQVDAEYQRRSPLTWLHQAKGLPIDINAGIHDGHTGSVPISHSLRAFNRLAEANGHTSSRFSPETIEELTVSAMVSPSMRSDPFPDEQRLKPVLLRRTAGPARITLFDGGHEGDAKAAIAWLAAQRRKTSPKKEKTDF